MHASTSRRTIVVIAATLLITSMATAALAAPIAAAPPEQQTLAKQARADARAEAKAARMAAKQARADARAEAKAARVEARAQAKAARMAAKQASTGKVTVCHKPGTPAEGTLEISASALPAHLAHEDVEGACDSTTPVSPTTCAEPGAAVTQASPDGTLDEDDDAACEDEQQVLVSIDAPETVEPGQALELQGSVSGFDDGDLAYAWSSTCLTDEELTDPAIIASEPATELLVVREDTLPAGATCDFTLTVTDEITGTNGSAAVTVEVVSLS